MERLKAACTAVGGQAAWAGQHGLSLPYVHDVCRGRRAPGPSILRGLDLRREAPTFVQETVEAARG